MEVQQNSQNSPSEQMRIWVDADSFPAPAKKTLLKAAKRREIPLTFVANRPIPFGVESPLFTMQVCPNTPGAADDFIAENARTGDLVATRDIPLAKRLVEKGVAAINDRGVEFNKENVDTMLKERELSIQWANLGISTGGKKTSYGKKEAHDFACCMDRVLERLSRL